MVTSAQLRAARGLINWTVRDLAAVSGVHRNTVTRLEADTSGAGHALATIVGTYEEFGVIFVDENGEGPGVRLRKGVDLSQVPRADSDGAVQRALTSPGVKKVNL